MLFEIVSNFDFSQNLLLSFALLMLVIAIFSYITKLFKQPLMLAYIIAGIILGPAFLNLIEPSPILTLFSQMGIAFLLFLVGLNLDFKILKQVGSASLISGAGQVVFTSLVGYLIVRVLGFGFVEAMYIAVALTFSSTIIVVKLLSDKKDLDSLHGRISIGILIVQDIIAMIILIVIAGFSQNNLLEFDALLFTLAKGIALVLVILILVKFVIKPLVKSVAESPELLFLSSIAWCFLIFALFHIAGFSLEIGAFLAGISIAGIVYTREIIFRIEPLRDFFIVLFFIALGLRVGLESISKAIFPTIILSLFVLFVKPLIVLPLIGLIGYKKRTGFLTGVSLAQVSEFSLILVALGLTFGHLTNEAVSLVTLVAIITIAVSSYMVTHGDKLYTFFSKYLNIFERKSLKENELAIFTSFKDYEVVLFGGHRIGRVIVNALQRINKTRKKKINFLVVDYDPNIIEKMTNKKAHSIYGDVADEEILDAINFNKTKIVISTIPSLDDNLNLIGRIRKRNKKVVIFVTTMHMHEAEILYQAGANQVILPYLLSGDKIVELLKDINHKGVLKELKRKQISEIKEFTDLQLTKN